jgi:hypothetical protein
VYIPLVHDGDDATLIDADLLSGRLRHVEVLARKVAPSAVVIQERFVGALDLGGPSTCRLARSMKAEDKDSPHGGQTEALPDGQPPLPSGEETPTCPLVGRRQRQPLSRLHIVGRCSSPTGGGSEPAESSAGLEAPRAW